MSRTRRLRSLYLCYLSLEDPLVHTQVVAYLRGLAAAGHEMRLLTFEVHRLSRAQRRGMRRMLADQGIRWYAVRYHKRPSLPATVYDTVVGALVAATLVLRHRLDVLHARNHVPAAMALIVRRLLWRRPPALIFDIRGLMAEEYEDAGRWRHGSVAFRLTKKVERAAIDAAAGVVVLTRRLRRLLFGDDSSQHVQVIPCTADLESLAAAAHARRRVRQELGLEDATVLIYLGKFGGWYMAHEMATFFVAARRQIPDLHFLILTQGERGEIDEELRRSGAAPSGYTITSASATRMGEFLAAGDVGISFIRPAPSKISSSPTKVGEYLAAGLPVVATSGVGDLDELIVPEVGALVMEHSPAAYEAAAAHIRALLDDRATSERCRAVARRELSLADVGIPRYARLYDEVAWRLDLEMGGAAVEGGRNTGVVQQRQRQGAGR